MSSLLVGAKGPNLLSDMVLIEETAHFNRERIPERVVHAKGAAAYGEFVVTDTYISKFTKASLFASKSIKTPVVVRFSHVAGESGIADSMRDVRGFAVKFYTQTGNWDLVGNNLPVFFVRDPINFVSFIHALKRNPKTHLRDPDAFWDFIGMLPESLHATVMMFSSLGIPDGFRHMNGFGVDTFRLVKSKGKDFYVKFHWVSEQQVKNLSPNEATVKAGGDPDYFLRDLQASIENEVYPSWILKFQVMTPEGAENLTFNALDPTKIWPIKNYPLHEIGRMTLKKNPENYFAEVEQLAFSPGNFIPGIESSPDKMLQARMFSYGDTQRYRLGVNYPDLPVNRPRCPLMTPTYNDGRHFDKPTSSAIPNYIPSINHGKVNEIDENYVEQAQFFSGNVGRYDLSDDDNYSQVTDFVNALGEQDRANLAKNIAESLKMVTNKKIVQRVIYHFDKVKPSLASAIQASLT